MSEELLIQHCSPTLAGIKTAGLFSCAYNSEAEVRAEARRLNKLLVPKGLRLVPLRFAKNYVLVYVYRPAKLARDLKDAKAAAILKALGYPCDKPQLCVAALAQRLKACPKFPHEIGLFLGYPPEDVEGFIKNNACCCKCSGIWKVYGDEETAQRLFTQYKKCTDVYCRLWSQGRSIERLTVSAACGGAAASV